VSNRIPESAENEFSGLEAELAWITNKSLQFRNAKGT
jgi:hypothetical protein